MPSQGPNSCGTGADDASTGSVTWSNPGNITASDDNRATAALNASQETHYLKATNFGHSIPSSTINGILEEWELSQVAIDGSCSTVHTKMVQLGTIIGKDNKDAFTWGAVDAYHSYGSSSELWAVSWTFTDFNDSTTGTVISASEDLSGSTTARVDHVRQTVTYTVTVDATQVPFFEDHFFRRSPIVSIAYFWDGRNFLKEPTEFLGVVTDGVTHGLRFRQTRYARRIENFVPMENRSCRLLESQRKRQIVSIAKRNSNSIAVCPAVDFAHELAIGRI